MQKIVRKKLKLSALLLLLCSMLGIGCVPGVSAEKTNYTDFFEKDSVINIEIFMEDEDLADMRAYPTNEEYHNVDVTVDGVTVTDVGLRTKGNMTLRSVAGSDSERYSYRLKFDKYVKGQTLLGLDELCLNNQYSDPSYMREYLHYEMLRSLGMQVPETVFCTVSINGEYAGFYLAVEGLDDTFLEDAFGSDYESGNFYKMDEGATLAYREDETYSYADLKVGSDSDLTEFKSFISRLNAIEDGEKGDIESFLDVASALKYIAANTVLCNYDSYNGNMHHNYYLYENTNGIFTVIPWDFNMSFGGFNGANATIGIDTPVASGSIDELPLIGKLLAIPEYKQEYYGYIKQLMTELEDFESRVNELKNVISFYVKADATAFYSYDEFDANTSLDVKETKTEQQNEGAQKEHKAFGGNVSIVQCAADRLANLKAQFDGTADTETQNRQNGFGGGAPDGGHGRHGGNPPDMQDGQQPPEMPSGQERPDMQDNNGAPFGGGRPQGNMQGGFGRPEEHKNESAQTKPIRVHVNGHIISFDTNPFIAESGSTLVGYRAIMEALGADVEWDEATQTVTAEKDGTTVSLTIGSDCAYVNGEAQTLPQAAEIKDGSTMIPLRFIGEALKMKVGWTEESRLITITSK